MYIKVILPREFYAKLAKEDVEYLESSLPEALSSLNNDNSYVVRTSRFVCDEIKPLGLFMERQLEILTKKEINEVDVNDDSLEGSLIAINGNNEKQVIELSIKGDILKMKVKYNVKLKSEVVKRYGCFTSM